MEIRCESYSLASVSFFFLFSFSFEGGGVRWCLWS